MDVDLVGIIFHVQETSTIKGKYSIEVPRYIITMLDLSHNIIDDTLWGIIGNREVLYLEHKYYLQEIVVFSIKNGRTYTFNGRVITTLSNTSLLINPVIQETE